MFTMLSSIRVMDTVWRTAVIIMLLKSAAGQQTPGFISIDCGGNAQFKDPATNLTWEKDAPYILTGMDGEVPYPPNSSTDNYQALRTFKYFPERRNKYCYELPVRRNISILIRAMFLHGNSSELELPIRFDVYMGATLWSSVQYEMEDSSIHSPKVLEGIFYSPDYIDIDYNYFCLVRDQGIPFISSLELRQLDSEGMMYSSIDREKLFLSNLCRYNYGAPNDMRTVRYPDDAYDRLWITPGPKGPSFGDSQISSRKVYPNTSSVWNNVPPAVMMTAWIINGTGFGTSQQLPLKLTNSDGGYLYAIFYSETLSETSQYLGMSIYLNGDETKPFNVSNIPISKFFNHFATATNNVSVGMFSTSTAILNAFEIYEERIVSDDVTSASLVDFIVSLKATLNLTDWQGDPCLPIPYDWIECDRFSGSNLWEFANLTLSKLNNTANLQNIDQQRQQFLEGLSLTYSDVDDATFQFLVTNLTNVIYDLNFTSNRISTIPDEHVWVDRMARLPYYIDLSHNFLAGEVPTFSHSMAESVRVQHLNLSHNSFSSFSSFWGNSTPGFFNLTILDVSYNSISSDVSSSSITDMLRRNSMLEELHMSDNFLTGIFPSDFYFTRKNLPNLSVLNLDRNNLTGGLNLSPWLQRLQQAFEISNLPPAPELYSFVANNIIEVTPNIDDFEHVILSLMTNFSQFNRSGVLLYGNPFCNKLNAKSFTKRYLCRASVTTSIFEDHDKKNSLNKVLISSIIVLSFCFVGFTFIIWRLWRKLSAASKLLTEVQQELTNRRVQPPFYPYHDLKVATKNFHEDNKLGSGAFGAVYKGILPDGTTIAAKRLFNSEKEAVLNDFLNEVVSITGIKHRHLVQLKGCCIKDKERILVYEFANNGNLAEALWGQNLSRMLHWAERLKIAIGIARGLSYLHEELQPRIIHRDIKAANVLLDDSFAPKIADFGLAKLFEDEETQAQFTAVAGTRGYFAPEYVLEGQLTTKADVYSFGILLLEILTGKKCIDVTQSANRVYLKNWAEDLQKEGSLSELLSSDLQVNCSEQEFTRVINIALLCTQVNPQFRPPMSQVVIMLSESKVVSTGWTIDSSQEQNIDFNISGLQNVDPSLRSPPGIPTYEETPLVSNLSSSNIRSDYPEPLQKDWLSTLRSKFTSSEKVHFRRSQSFPTTLHTQ